MYEKSQPEKVKIEKSFLLHSVYKVDNTVNVVQGNFAMKLLRTHYNGHSRGSMLRHFTEMTTLRRVRWFNDHLSCTNCLTKVEQLL